MTARRTLTLARRALVDEARVARSTRLLVAVSGGIDSMVLLHVLSRLGERLGLTLFAEGVDHGLRAEAGAELDRAERFAEQLGLPPWKLIDVTVDGEDLFSSSIPFALEATQQRDLVRPGDLGLIVAVGSGIQVGCALYHF